MRKESRPKIGAAAEMVVVVNRRRGRTAADSIFCGGDEGCGTGFGGGQWTELESEEC